MSDKYLDPPDEGMDADVMWERVYDSLEKELVEFVKDEFERVERKAGNYMRQNILLLQKIKKEDK